MSFTNFSPQKTLSNLVKTLDTYGVAVLPNVFAHEECESVKANVYEYLAQNHNVHVADDYEKMRPLGGGVLHSYGISLIQEVLKMKTDERVEIIFKNIWNHDEVTMSLDGITISPPPEQLRNSRERFPVGFHTDQSSHRKEKCCIQSFITLEDCEDGDACLSVLTKSHNLHSAFFNHFDIDTKGRDWFVINKTHFDWFCQNNCKTIFFF
jgi:hypothetical protein